jgi:hypothetical protein
MITTIRHRPAQHPATASPALDQFNPIDPSHPSFYIRKVQPPLIPRTSFSSFFFLYFSLAAEALLLSLCFSLFLAAHLLLREAAGT